VEGVKSVSILIVGLIAVNHSIAQTAAVALPSCSSSPHVVINAAQVTKNASDPYVDIYRVTGSDEVLYLNSKADAHGVVTFPELPAGKYRVFADDGKQSAEMYLMVSQGHNTVPCEMKFPAPGTRYYRSYKTIVIKELRGIVQGDKTRSPVEMPSPVRAEKITAMPRVKVTLSRDGDHNSPNVTVIETDQEGKFAFRNLTDGWYWVRFEPPKESYLFCRVSFQMKVAPEGWTGLKLSLAPWVSVAPGFCEKTSVLENLSTKSN
jgi:hypothetical protein